MKSGCKDLFGAKVTVSICKYCYLYQGV